MGNRRDDAEDHRLPELFSESKWVSLAERFQLTTRQLEMARRVCRGMTNPEIAQEVGITGNTVRMHVRDLFRRLRVRDRVGVVVRLVYEDRHLDEARLNR